MENTDLFVLRVAEYYIDQILRYNNLKIYFIVLTETGRSFERQG